jgi:hypothetical protein
MGHLSRAHGDDIGSGGEEVEEAEAEEALLR